MRNFSFIFIFNHINNFIYIRLNISINKYGKSFFNDTYQHFRNFFHYSNFNILLLQNIKIYVLLKHSLYASHTN